MSCVESLGIIGLILVFASFIIKKWIWLYALNLSGAILLAIYAHLVGNTIFFILQCGISILLSYRLIVTIKNMNKKQNNPSRANID